MSINTLPSNRKVHHGHNIKCIREMIGMKQETFAERLGVSQQAVSKLEAKGMIDKEQLIKAAEVLKIPVEVLENFNEEAAINVIANTFNDTLIQENSSFIAYNPSFNPIDKVIELYERMLKAERDKVEFLEKFIKDKM